MLADYIGALRKGKHPFFLTPLGFPCTQAKWPYCRAISWFHSLLSSHAQCLQATTNTAQFFQKKTPTALWFITLRQVGYSWEPGSWETEWMRWSQEFSVQRGGQRTCFCKGHQKTYMYAGSLTDGAPGLYEEWRTRLYLLWNCSKLMQCHG